MTLYPFGSKLVGMYWTLLIVSSYLSTLTAGGLPMADSGAKPQSIGVPGPTVDPEVETLNFHLYCRDFVMLNTPDWEASISYPEPQSNSRPGSPQSSRPVSPDPGGPVRRADAPPPVFLMGRCKMPSGRDRLVSLNLNKCLGWDDDRKVFTSEYEYVSIL